MWELGSSVPCSHLWGQVSRYIRWGLRCSEQPHPFCAGMFQEMHMQSLLGLWALPHQTPPGRALAACSEAEKDLPGGPRGAAWAFSPSHHAPGGRGGSALGEAAGITVIANCEEEPVPPETHGSVHRGCSPGRPVRFSRDHVLLQARGRRGSCLEDGPALAGRARLWLLLSCYFYKLAFASHELKLI